MMAQWFDVFDKLLSAKDVMDDENDKVSLCVVGVTLVNWIHEFHPDKDLQPGLLVNQDIYVIKPWYITLPLPLLRCPSIQTCQSSPDLDRCNQIIASGSEGEVRNTIQD